MCKPKTPKAPPNPYTSITKYEQATAQMERANAGGNPKDIKYATKELKKADKAYTESGGRAMKEAEDRQRADQQAAYDRMMEDQRINREQSERQFQQQMTAQTAAQERAMQQQQGAIAQQQQQAAAQAAEARRLQEEASERSRREGVARTDEQRRLASAGPAPAPNQSATTTRPTLAISPQRRAASLGRRSYRTSGGLAIAGSGSGVAGLNIPMG